MPCITRKVVPKSLLFFLIFCSLLLKVELMDSVASCSKASNTNACTSNVIASNDQWDKLDDTMVGNILARVFMFDFFQCQLVCKRWDSIIDNQTFQTVAHQLINRAPWFLMVDSNYNVDTIYDMETKNWRQGHLPMPVPDQIDGKHVTRVVASSGNIICFVTDAGYMIVSIPLTPYGRVITGFLINEHVTAIALHGDKTSFEVFVVLEKQSALAMKKFSSTDNKWSEELRMQKQMLRSGREKRYFLDRYCKYSFFSKLQGGLTSIDSDGKIMVYYINDENRLMKCDSNQCIAYMYPGFECPDPGDCFLDIVVCGGCVYVVVLLQFHQFDEFSEEINAAYLRILKFDYEKKLWNRIAEMPGKMSEIYLDKEVDIRCCGYGNHIMICLSTWDTDDYSDVFTYDMVKDVWDYLPPCVDRYTRSHKKFIAAYPIFPDNGERERPKQQTDLGV